MVNIIFDEKRFLKVGEVCAIKLSDIQSYRATLDYDGKIYFGLSEKGLGLSDGVTFIKYLGNGMFTELLSEQLIRLEVTDPEAIGSDELLILPDKHQNTLSDLSNKCYSLANPENINDYKEKYETFMETPLALYFDYNTEFMAIDKEILVTFGSQQLEIIKKDILKAKIAAQNLLQDSYNKFDGHLNKNHFIDQVDSKQTR